VTEYLIGLPFYFPQPHQPWQNGPNENANGLLIEYFPNDTNKKMLCFKLKLLIVNDVIAVEHI